MRGMKWHLGNYPTDC